MAQNLKNPENIPVNRESCAQKTLIQFRDVRTGSNFWHIPSGSEFRKLGRHVAQEINGPVELAYFGSEEIVNALPATSASKHRVLVYVIGGVAYTSQDPEVNVHIMDMDNDPDAEVPAAFADLAESISA